MSPFSKHLQTALLIAAAFAACLASGCTPPPAAPPEALFTQQEITGLLESLAEQNRLVTSAVYTGTLTFGKDGSESTVHLLVAGTRNPLRLKIELTHSWGSPLVHILVEENDVGVLSFREKNLLLGTLDEDLFRPYFPGALHADQLWALARIFPSAEAHQRAVSIRPQEITLLSTAGTEYQRIDFDTRDSNPVLSSFPQQGLRFSFSKFTEAGNVRYARKLRIETHTEDHFIEIATDEVTFNTSIPESIFALEVPPGYRTVHLRQGVME